MWRNLTAIIKHGLQNDDDTSLRVRTDFMELLMENVLTLPRSVVGFPENRDVIGGLIFGTFAVSGLMVRTEPFKFSPISAEDNRTWVSTVYSSRYPVKIFSEPFDDISRNQVTNIS